MQIRLLTPDDAPEWWRLRHESLTCDPEAFSSSADDPQSLKMEDVRNRLRADSSEFFIVGAFDDGRLSGMAGFVREAGAKSRHKGRIWGVYVGTAKRGHGLGRKLLEAVLARSSDLEGIEQIMISVTATQTAAIALYRSLGFESFGREPRALKIGPRYIDEEYLSLPSKPL
jgi:ribosomal protein S18 acetylase RimI-like enzyme